MKLRPELIGAKVYHPTLNINILIEEGKEDKYSKLGMDVFIRTKPKLQSNAKNTKRREHNIDTDVIGTDND